jgi:hypothetical protein
LPGGVLHDAIMHCSYADQASRHDVKKPINRLIRKKYLSRNLEDLRHTVTAPSAGNKPVVVVVFEWFSKQHSIYRTHSRTIEGMTQFFHVIGVGYEACVDEVGRAVTNEFITLRLGEDIWQNISQIRDLCLDRNAQILYMPSVGMFTLSVFLANIRVAPIQMMALGHPATTHSQVMDYVVVEEDYVGDSTCFSEQLLKLPKDCMPYRPPSGMIDLELSRKRSQEDKTVRIAIAATIMKFNPSLMEVLRAIAQSAQAPTEFHFLVGQATGITLPQVHRLVARYLSNKGVVHAHQDYVQYMETIKECDLFLNPFPFGNTNGIIDTVYAGLVGVCKTGPEVFEHIDEGLFNRLNFPDWLIAKNNEQYIEAALKLIDNAQLRKELSDQLAGPSAIEKLIFQGRPQILGEMMQGIWHEKLDALAGTAATV